MSVQELKERLSLVEKEALEALHQADSAESLETMRLHYLGQKGVLTAVLRSLSSLGKQERPAVGQLANRIKETIQAGIDDRREALYQQELAQRLSQETIDVTLPGAGRRLGHIHPLTRVVDDILQIFYGMGFQSVEGPEIETEYYNFDALNTPTDHPARDEQDTFFTSLHPSVLLRSQTSTVQIRVMEERKPPLRIISAGRVYRNEEINARKYPLFHQAEGLLVDENVTFGQLKGTLNQFIAKFFRRPLKTRFRPDFFPFTEPSAELDSQCPFCLGEGCRTCGHRGWIELLGCGLVDPAVLEAVGIDSERWIGFAFGMGIDRLAMLKYGVNDIRHLFSSDLRFLEQF